MALPANVDEFLDLVKKSGVADEKRLDAYLQKMRATLPPDPPKVAGILVRDGLLTHFQAENILAGKWRRFSIGKYKVLEKLGSGGFAQVYLCEHKLMRRRVAVKVLPVAKTKDSSALERFYREARAVAALDHPNIVHAYDIDQDEDLHFLVMEYVDGANLQDIVKKSGPLSVVRSCNYIRQAALALQHAHEHGLVHRDIKPGNVLVDRTGVVKVLDMGLALFFNEEEDQLTKKHDDGTLGTADYLSPEQAMDSHDVDIRTDIYSLGVTFYYLLTGRPPFEGMQIAQKLMAHQQREPRSIAEFRKDVPAGLMAVISKMMAKSADKRYPTPGDVVEALGPFTQDAIAPPAEAEMPHLSPAATGQPAGPETAEQMTPPRSAPSSGSTIKSPSGATPPARSAPPSSGAGKPVPAAPAPAPVPAATLAPAASIDVGEIPPWEQPEASPNDTPTMEADTAPTSKRAARAKRIPKTPETNKAFLLVIAAILTVSVCGTGIIGAVIWIFYPAREQKGPSGPPRLEVSRDPNRKNVYRTIQQAVRDAQIDATIELTDETYEENVVIDPSMGRRTRFTLQAAPGVKTVVWRSARKDPETPILRVSKAVDFKLKGKGIILDGAIDGKRNVNDLMMITAESPGLAIEDLQLRNFARSAVFIMNAAGTADRPIRLLSLKTEPADKARSAVYFDANAKVIPPINDHIEILDCDFRGFDPAKAIQVKDNTVVGNDARWPGR